MTLSPVLPWWVLAPALLLVAGYVVWQLVASGPKHRLAWALRLVAVVLLTGVALRPALPPDGAGPQVRGGLEVYFAVDTTSSMAAEDWAEGRPRLDGVKADVAAIAEALSGAQFSLVTFDSSTVERVPLTSDASALVSGVDVLTQEITDYSRGSSIDAPLTFLEQLLADAEEARPQQDRVLFYLGDGEQTAAVPPESFAPLADLVDGGAVLGYGTEEGGRMLEFDGYADEFSELGYIQDRSQSPSVDAISRIDETNLQTIADDLGLGYLHRTADAPVGSAVEGIDVGELVVEDAEISGPFELYWILAIPFGLLMLREGVLLVAPAAELRAARRGLP